VLPGTRFRFIDAARAVAMLFVFLSHFVESFFGAERSTTREIIRQISLVASPSFVITSGVLIGFLSRTQRDRFAALKIRLIDRGIFLLTIGHLLLSGSFVLSVNTSFADIVEHTLFVTDAIGVSLIVTPMLVTRFAPMTRLGMSTALFTLSWLVIITWHPHTVLGSALQETVFGSGSPVFYAYAFPLLPWFSLHVAGTVLGEQLGERLLRGDQRGMLHLLGQVGAGCAILAFAIKSLYVAARWYGVRGAFMYALTSPFQKYPPSPAYLLFYAGVGVGIVLTGCLLVERYDLISLKWASALGQTSLGMFIIQSYVYYFGVHSLAPYLSKSLWPVWLVLSIAVNLALTWMWRRWNLNRFITVGYRQFMERRAAQVRDEEALA